MLLRSAALIALYAGVAVGDLVQYKFREAPLNGGSVQSLQDLHGTPVLIEFWGRN
jgi:hypothetical protein